MTPSWNMNNYKLFFQTIFGIEGCHFIAASTRSQVTEGGIPNRLKG
jgi:hypothetical protein